MSQAATPRQGTKWAPHPNDPYHMVNITAVVEGLRNPSLLSPRSELDNRMLAAQLIEGWGGGT